MNFIFFIFLLSAFIPLAGKIVCSIDMGFDFEIVKDKHHLFQLFIKVELMRCGKLGQEIEQ